MERTIAIHGGGRCPRCRGRIAKDEEIARVNRTSRWHHDECAPEPGQTDDDLVRRLERDAQSRAESTNERSHAA